MADAVSVLGQFCCCLPGCSGSSSGFEQRHGAMSQKHCISYLACCCECQHPQAAYSAYGAFHHHSPVGLRSRVVQTLWQQNLSSKQLLSVEGPGGVVLVGVGAGPSSSGTTKKSNYKREKREKRQRFYSHCQTSFTTLTTPTQKPSAAHIPV